MKKEYAIGLDLGINNVGWSIITKEDNDVQIEKEGVRLYTASSNAEDRRNSRASRRRKRRINSRIDDTLALFKSVNFPTKNTIDSKLLSKRIKGLREKLEEQEIVNICCYFVSHRGYIPFGDEERELIVLDGKYPCEYYQELLNSENKYRALEKVVNNKDLQKELKDILNNQKKYYKEIDDELIDKILKIFTRKRKFWEGPGSTKALTPYGRFKTEQDVIEYNSSNKEKYLYDDLVGKCSICIHENVSGISNYYYEKFNLLNDFINIVISNSDTIIDQKDIFKLDNGYYKLSSQGLNKIIEICKSNVAIKYTDIFKLLGIDKENVSGNRIDKEGKPEYSTMKTYRSIKKICINNNASEEIYQNIGIYNELIQIFTLVPGFVEARNMIEQDEKLSDFFDENDFKCLNEIYIKLKKDGSLKWGSFSEKALKRATADMINECLNYSSVSKKFKYDEEKKQEYLASYSSDNSKLLHISPKYIDDIIASPQVKKTLRQSIRIINAIIDEKGYYPNIISVESTKEMNSKDQRKAIEFEQKENEKSRKIARKILEENFGEKSITEKNILKVQLYNELDGRCAYCNKPFKNGLNDVINNNFETEHILPLSKSGNDSYNNKTLACRDCNETKNNRTPYQWLVGDKFEEFESRILKLNISQEKKNNFLEKTDLDKYKQRFFNRNLRDTSYATKELINQIKMFNWILEECEEEKIKTFSTPGQLTSNIRDELKTKKDRDDGKYHHAVDASIVGLLPYTTIGQEILEMQNDAKYFIKNKKIYKLFDKEEFKKNLNYELIKDNIKNIDSDEKIYISDQVNKDTNKQISDANIIKYIKKDDSFYAINQIDNIYDKDLLKNSKINELFGDSSKYTLLIKDNDKELFEFLRDIFNNKNYNDDKKSNPFVNYCCEVNDVNIKEFKELKHGIKYKNRPLVKKLRYYEKANNPFLLENKKVNKKDNTYIGLDSCSQYCTRIYFDKDKKEFIFIPVYITSINLTTGKINKNDKTYQFYINKYLKDKHVTYITDLFNGNRIKVEKSDNTYIEDAVSYYHKTNNKICLKKGGYFTKSDKQITIYDVDILGNKKERLTWKAK